MKMTNKLIEILNYYEHLKRDKKTYHMGTVFQTRNNSYFYDTGTGKIFDCSADEYLIFSYLTHKLISIEEVRTKIKDIELLYDIKEFIKQENLFQMPRYKNFAYGDIKFLKMAVNESLNQLILELTQECNLRCSYCIYNNKNKDYRNFLKEDMPWEVAKKAIDYAKLHSAHNVAVTFYGGEPLLKFDLLKRCIQYSNLIMGDSKNVTFGLTTNLTLVTPEMALFFASLKSCSIMGSIDGTEEIHDKCRRTINNGGTFNKAINGLRLLVEAREKVGINNLNLIINTVLTPPYTYNKYNDIKNFFKKLIWLPKDVTIRYNYVEENNDSEFDIDVENFYNQDISFYNPISFWNTESICNTDSYDYELEQEKLSLLKIHKRYIGDEPLSYVLRNGCCIPGSRRLYITTNGKFKVCEKLGNSPYIGDIENGIDINKIKKYYIDNYTKETLTRCSKCWAIHLCSACYNGIYDNDGIHVGKRKLVCLAERANVKGRLISYHQILEENPKSLDSLNKLTLS